MTFALPKSERAHTRRGEQPIDGKGESIMRHPILRNQLSVITISLSLFAALCCTEIREPDGQNTNPSIVSETAAVERYHEEDYMTVMDWNWYGPLQGTLPNNSRASVIWEPTKGILTDLLPRAFICSMVKKDAP